MDVDVELLGLPSEDVKGAETPVDVLEKVDVTVVLPIVMTVMPCPAPTPSPPSALDWLALVVKFVKPDGVREREDDTEFGTELTAELVMAGSGEDVEGVDSVSDVEPSTASVAAVV